MQGKLLDRAIVSPDFWTTCHVYICAKASNRTCAASQLLPLSRLRRAGQFQLGTLYGPTCIPQMCTLKVGSLVGWLVGWLVAWLLGCLVGVRPALVSEARPALAPPRPKLMHTPLVALRNGRSFYTPPQFGCGSKPMVPFWGRCTNHFSHLF